MTLSFPFVLLFVPAGELFVPPSLLLLLLLRLGCVYVLCLDLFKRQDRSNRTHDETEYPDTGGGDGFTRALLLLL
jgi:hypothetical protein